MDAVTLKLPPLINQVCHEKIYNIKHSGILVFQKKHIKRLKKSRSSCLLLFKNISETIQILVILVHIYGVIKMFQALC